jgi:uncharacterized DUF497 family protein
VVDFEWDEEKAKENLEKHGIDFADAAMVLSDTMALTMPDPASEEEDRLVTLGNDALERLLVVAYTWREDRVRLISAEGDAPGAAPVRGQANMKREYDFSKARRGPVVPVPTGKTRITIRLDDDVLDWFRKQVHDAGGGNYQTLINNALREFIRHRGQPLEETIRRVLREELHKRPRRAAASGSRAV